MRCKRVQALISSYLDQMTDERETGLIEEHLASCLACRQFMDQMKAVSDMLKRMDRPLPPSGFADDFRRRLQQEPSPRPRWRISSFLRPLILKSAGNRFKHEVVRFYHWRHKTVE